MLAVAKAYNFRGSSHEPLRPQPSFLTGVQNCCLLGPVTAICCYRCSRLPFARPQNLQTVGGSCHKPLDHSHLSLPAFNTAVCKASKP